MPNSDASNAYVGWTEGNKQGGMWGGVGGAIDGYFGGPIFQAHMDRLKDWYTFPQLDRLELQSPAAGLDKWLQQVPYADRLNKVLDLLNQKDNAAFQKTLSSADSNLIRNAGLFGANTGAYLRGEIPKDVADQVRRQSAYKSLVGGYGGSGMSKALTARDFGLTSLDLQKRGGDQLSQELGLAMTLNPQRNTAMSMFTNAQDLLQREDRATVYNNSLANQQKALDFASHLATSGGGTEALTGMIGGMYGGGSRPAAQPQQSGGGGFDISSLMKMFGGGGGYGGGMSSSGGSYGGFGG